MSTSKVSYATQRGPRAYQEDRSACVPLEGPPGEWLLGVFDGHGGGEAAEACTRTIACHERSFPLDDPKKTLRALVKEIADATAEMFAGSTLSLALISESRKIATIAILGDSPVVTLDGNDKVRRSIEHNVRTNSRERNAAIARGGIYTPDGYICDPGQRYGLQMGRALGDARLGTVVSHIPTIYTVQDPQWVLVASDGVFDPSHKDRSLMRKVRILAHNHANADEVMCWALERELHDNATAVVWSKE